MPDQYLATLKRAGLICPFTVKAKEYGIGELLDMSLCWFKAENALRVGADQRSLLATDCDYSSDFPECPIYTTNAPEL